MSTALFIPLKTAYYDAFVDGSKTVEYRRYGKGWRMMSKRDAIALLKSSFCQHN